MRTAPQRSPAYPFPAYGQPPTLQHVDALRPAALEPRADRKFVLAAVVRNGHALVHAAPERGLTVRLSSQLWHSTWTPYGSLLWSLGPTARLSSRLWH